MRLPTTLLFLASTACGTGPVLVAPVPARLPSFSLADSASVVQRVEQVFNCPAVTVPLPPGTLGWRRDSTFVDITMVQEFFPAGVHGGPSRSCWKGFRVEAEGRIFALPEKDWPYTTFRKRVAIRPRA